jgi:hypothetical protein
MKVKMSLLEYWKLLMDRHEKWDRHGCARERGCRF